MFASFQGFSKIPHQVNTDHLKTLDQICKENGALFLTPATKPKEKDEIFQLDEQTGEIILKPVEGLVGADSLVLNHTKVCTILRRGVEIQFGGLKKVLFERN